MTELHQSNTQRKNNTLNESSVERNLIKKCRNDLQDNQNMRMYSKTQYQIEILRFVIVRYLTNLADRE